MKINQIPFSLFLLILYANSSAFCQSNNDLFNKALQLKTTAKFYESFAIFKQLLRSDSSNVEFLHNTSYLYSKLGFDQPGENSKNNYYNIASYLAQKAIGINKNSAGAHFSYALALGRLTEHASNKQKLANAKLIKSECDKTLKLDPKNAGAWHILGRWHREIAGFNVFEKLLINTLLGGMPEGGSYDAAIDCFKKSIQLEPNQILHYYELSLSYYQRNNDYRDKIAAKVWLQKALAIPDNKNDTDFSVYKRQCQELLKKVN